MRRFHIKPRFPASFEKNNRGKYDQNFLKKDDLVLIPEGEESGEHMKRAWPWPPTLQCLSWVLSPPTSLNWHSTTMWTITLKTWLQRSLVGKPYCRPWLASLLRVACQALVAIWFCAPSMGLYIKSNFRSSSSLKFNPYEHGNALNRICTLRFKNKFCITVQKTLSAHFARTESRVFGDT